ncbi:MAG: diguanylate cyclase [candidate division KSB1 bacterium]|nr:diguanylate cyclase [candidate division KSB1 bacterium]MDZ7304513.1 diguanylate cyclase [candidate division KSB1 bacterium]MDZ7313893.1 diguanylate cyclase [candidate division KSB1 bacterium]
MNWFNQMGIELSIKPVLRNAALGGLPPKNKILVVDDVPVNVQLLTTYLTSVGYEVFTAKDGQEALTQVADTQPDLILLDVMMPKLNGFEVCERLKADPKTRIIPVIMVTALNEIEDKIKATESGADDFVSKPFNKLELLTRVKSLLRIKQLHDELSGKVRELEQARERLRQLAITDGLTGLYNHRYLKEHLEHEIYRASRHQSHVSVIMIDIDHFKKFNDTHGHPAGDAILRGIARLLKENIRKIDLAARYGGEEFCLVLVETNKAAASIVAEKVRRLVEAHHFDVVKDSQTVPGMAPNNTSLMEWPANSAFGEPTLSLAETALAVAAEEWPEQGTAMSNHFGRNSRITISMGVATFPEDAGELDQLIEIADQRLYRAKKQGRNQVVTD